MSFGQVNADVIGTSVAGSNIGAGNASIMKNRIINGAMVIDQRNAGASVTPFAGQYSVDRWQCDLVQNGKYAIQQSSTAPIGFTNSLLSTSLSSYSVASTDYFAFWQKIEGYNIADLGWGTVNAKTVTLSFWVQSSLTGTFGGSIANGAFNYSYPFSYTISLANTWTQISVTISGPTAGTWLATNNTGLRVCFSLGSGTTYSGAAGSWSSSFYTSCTGATSVVGTNGATFYITGVQFEVGSSATGFEYRQYQQELALCERYCETSYDVGVKPGTPSSNLGSPQTYVQSSGALITGGALSVQYRTKKRADPTVTMYSPVSGTAGNVYDGNTGTDRTANVDLIGQSGFRANCSFSAQAALNIQGHHLSVSEL